MMSQDDYANGKTLYDYSDIQMINIMNCHSCSFYGLSYVIFQKMLNVKGTSSNVPSHIAFP